MTKKFLQKLTETYGFPVNTAKDCRLLSDKIEEKTQRRISQSTLRRLYGLLPSKSAISKYNLDTLAIYCGYTDYQQFVNQFCNNAQSQNDSCNEALEEITAKTLRSIKNKSLIPFEQTISREGLNRNLGSFLDSAHSIFPLIAPGGNGKSVALAHWIKAKAESDVNILFCNAEEFYELIIPSGKKLKIDLRIDSPESIFCASRDTNRQTILVIDSVDELVANYKKVETFITYLNVLIEIFPAKYLKIVFSVRDTTWDFTFKPYFLKQGFANLRLSTEIRSANYLTGLTSTEIKQILSNHNQHSQTPIIYDSILWDILKLLEIPFNIYLLTSLREKNIPIENIDQQQLLHAYLQTFVFEAKYAEQKEDILWEILKQMDNKAFHVPKNVIKDKFPIHFKRETGYYNGYHELLSHGVLEEERVENKYGLLTTVIQFKHLNFYFYLTALKYTGLNNGLTFKTFEEIANTGNELSWKTAIISSLFEIAYHKENFEAIKDFCNLPVEFHDNLHTRFAVGRCFRVKNNIRNKVISEFAKSETGRVFYFEQFVDTNYLYNNYLHRIKVYLEHKQTPEAILFGNCISYLGSFLKLQKQKCIYYKNFIDSVEVDNSIHPWPIGRKVSVTLLHSYFVLGEPIFDPFQYVLKYRDIAYTYPGYLEFGLIAFEMSVIIALLLTSEYEAMEKILSDIYKNYKLYNLNDDFMLILAEKQNLLPTMFFEYARFKQCKPYSSDFPTKIDYILNNASNAYDDFQFQILLNYMLFDYYSSNDKEKSEHYFNCGLEISKYAGYEFYSTYLALQNPATTSQLKAEYVNQLKSRGFNPESFVLTSLVLDENLSNSL